MQFLDVFRVSRWLSGRSLLRLLLGSALLTTFAFDVPFLVILGSGGVWGNLLGAVHAGFHPPQVLWAIGLTFVANFVCDVGTVLITYRILRFVRETSMWRGLLAIGGDLIAALLLALLCVNSLAFIDELTKVSGLPHVPCCPDTLTEKIMSTKVAIRASRQEGATDKAERQAAVDRALDDLGRRRLSLAADTAVMLYVGTTFIPTAIVLSILVWLIVLKAFLSAVRWFLLDFLKRATPPDYRETKAFTLLAALLNVLILLGTLIRTLLT